MQGSVCRKVTNTIQNSPLKPQARNQAWKRELGQHYGPQGRCSYKDISFILKEKVEEGDKKKLARREQY